MRYTISVWRLVIGLTSVPSAVAAQAIVAGPTTVISTDAPAVPHAETFLAANPKDPKNLLATAVRVAPDEGAGSAAYVSQDGGRTWSRVRVPREAEKVASGWDAIAYFDGGGAAYFAANDGDGLHITRSPDKGRTWGPATLLPGAEGFDRQFMGFDRTGQFAGRIYAGASVMTKAIDGVSRPALAVAVSTDGARTFGQPQVFSSHGDEHVFTFTDMVVTPDGTVILPFTTRMEQPRASTSLFEARNPAVAAAAGEPETWHLRMAVSGDGGKSYSITPRVLTYRSVNFTGSEAYRYRRTHGSFKMVVDASSGPFRGRLYFVWVDYAGDRHDIRVIHSSDKGRTWSKPVKVNDNTGPADQATPAIAVNDQGVVGVVWYDRRDHRDSCYELAFSASLDGGETFLPNVKAGQAKTCPFAPGNWVPRAKISPYPLTEAGRSVEGQGLNVLMISTRFPNAGETQGLEAGAGGVFHTAWADGSSGVMQLATTPFTVKGRAAETTTSASRDVSTQVKLVASQCAFDWTQKTFSCAMHLANTSNTAVEGPFEVELQNMKVNLTGFHVEGADNARSAEGARWRFALPPGSRALAAGATTAPRTFTWRFTGIPPIPEYPFMMFKVISTAAAAATGASK